ncbi:formin-like protein 4, partial [Falco rusticolus]|uniref:formin-like protein 4 n=1 Tax=Falco rusticolus TaxID=120794 RepID=UPI001886932F
MAAVGSRAASPPRLAACLGPAAGEVGGGGGGDWGCARPRDISRELSGRRAELSRDSRRPRPFGRQRARGGRRRHFAAGSGAADSISRAPPPAPPTPWKWSVRRRRRAPRTQAARQSAGWAARAPRSWTRARPGGRRRRMRPPLPSMPWGRRVAPGPPPAPHPAPTHRCTP